MISFFAIAITQELALEEFVNKQGKLYHYTHLDLLDPTLRVFAPIFMHPLSLIPSNIVTKVSVFNHFRQIKAQTLDQLIGPHSSPESLKTVVTIPENLPLSNSELEIRAQ